jgi:hypothetical protein
MNARHWQLRTGFLRGCLAEATLPHLDGARTKTTAGRRSTTSGNGRAVDPAADVFMTVIRNVVIGRGIIGSANGRSAAYFMMRSPSWPHWRHLPCLPHARRSSTRHPVKAAAAPSLHPMARASRHRVLRPSSKSPAWPWGGSARRSHLATSSGSHRTGDRFRLGSAVALELGPDSGEGAQWPIVVQGEPDGVLFLGLRIGLRCIFRETVEGDQAAAFWLQPAPASEGKTYFECLSRAGRPCAAVTAFPNASAPSRDRRRRYG